LMTFLSPGIETSINTFLFIITHYDIRSIVRDGYYYYYYYYYSQIPLRTWNPVTQHWTKLVENVLRRHTWAQCNNQFEGPLYLEPRLATSTEQSYYLRIKYVLHNVWSTDSTTLCTRPKVRLLKVGVCL
jgi:hypothetical protein